MNTTGVPLSPEPLVKSHNDPIKSVSTLGVVPSVIICPVKSASFSLISSLIASFNSSPFKSANLLSETYFNLISFGYPTNPSVCAGETTGSANSQIFPTGSLNAPSP